MKDFSIKLILLLVVGLSESVVGLPILFLAVSLRMIFADIKYDFVWSVLSSLFLSFFWGLPWWGALVILLSCHFVFEKITPTISNTILRLYVLVLPVSLLVMIIAEKEFSVRSLIYGCLSALLLFVFEKFWWVTKYQKRYL